MKTKITLLLALGIVASSIGFAQEKVQIQKSPTTVAPVHQAVPAKQAAPASTQAASTASSSSAEMTFEKLEHNFGTAKQGDVINYDYKFTNTGKEPLIISNATGSCGCTVPDWPKEPILKGGTGIIKVSFNSAGKSGMQDKTITITSNAKNSPVMLHIKGLVEDATMAPAKP